MRFGTAMRWVAVIVLVALMGAAWQLGQQRSTLPTRADVEGRMGAIEPAGPDEDGRPSAAIAHAHAQAEQRAEARDLQRARRDALRERILERERATIADESPRERDTEDDDDESPPAGAITDRIGGREALVAALDRDFMPLAGECIEQARERKPELRGMIALELELVADAELGAVIDTAGFSERNEVDEPELLDCIRETALSTTLPPPPQGGREALMLTLPVGDPARDDAQG